MEQASEIAMGYCDTYYTRTLKQALDTPSLSSTIDVDVCVVGGGIAGVSTAWELSQAGKSVALVEAERIGWGASGRNGGILSAGYAASLKSIEARVGLENAKALFDLSVEGIDIVVRNTKELSLPGVDLIEGVVSVSRHPDANGMQAEQRHMQECFGVELQYLPKSALRDLVKSERYFDGLLDPTAYHFHPLNYCIGLARAAQSAGVQVFEQTKMVSLDQNGLIKQVHTESGTIRAETVALCGGGYSSGAFGRVAQCLVPISTFVAVTQDLGSIARDIINTRAAVADTRLSCDYFRITQDDRLLWGGGMQGGRHDPDRLAETIKKDIVSVFPQLLDVEIEAAWSGVMGYARHKMPYLKKMAEGVWTATALGGHGMNTGPILGRLVAEAVCNDGTRHKAFEAFDLCWNGSFMGPIAANLICAASRHHDRKLESAPA